MDIVAPREDMVVTCHLFAIDVFFRTGNAQRTGNKRSLVDPRSCATFLVQCCCEYTRWSLSTTLSFLALSATNCNKDGFQSMSTRPWKTWRTTGTEKLPKKSNLFLLTVIRRTRAPQVWSLKTQVLCLGCSFLGTPFTATARQTQFSSIKRLQISGETTSGRVRLLLPQEENNWKLAKPLCFLLDMEVSKIWWTSCTTKKHAQVLFKGFQVMESKSVLLCLQVLFVASQSHWTHSSSALYIDLPPFTSLSLSRPCPSRAALFTLHG